MGFIEVLVIILVIAKLAGAIDWSWWWIFFPMIISAIIYIVVLGLVGTGFVLSACNGK